MEGFIATALKKETLSRGIVAYTNDIMRHVETARAALVDAAWHLDKGEVKDARKAIIQAQELLHEIY